MKRKDIGLLIMTVAFVALISVMVATAATSQNYRPNTSNRLSLTERVVALEKRVKKMDKRITTLKTELCHAAPLLLCNLESDNK